MDTSQPYIHSKKVSIPAGIRRIFVSRYEFHDVLPVDAYGVTKRMYDTRGLVLYARGLVNINCMMLMYL